MTLFAGFLAAFAALTSLMVAVGVAACFAAIVLATIRLVHTAGGRR